MSAELGLQAQKKLETRRALTAAATELFLERGYDHVTVAEIAARARAAVTTLFKYFPDGKDALVFGREDRVAAFEAAITSRPAGKTVLDAVEDFVLERALSAPGRDTTQAAIERLILETPALRAYARKMWADCEPVLAELLAKEAGRDVDTNTRALARFALEVPDLAAQDRSPREATAAVFSQLRNGWANSRR
ncbi:TetR/AcrR family transcriptional regulator [Kutzneria viridogrisea]|uniref:AcrR family transcriptional regulator n=1 Tax=Kutzneria viridogrisea TaxID=47990 RepID=A0ABR6BB96_9PSEU|nr:AcrR family transcriptional regulator [Kutzneria viridogrisea]